jgi:hypothetical protein
VVALAAHTLAYSTIAEHSAFGYKGLGQRSGTRLVWKVCWGGRGAPEKLVTRPIGLAEQSLW